MRLVVFDVDVKESDPARVVLSQQDFLGAPPCLAAMALAILHLTLPSINTAYSAWPASLTLHRPTLLPLCLPACS
jgi:hypothetical protein